MKLEEIGSNLGGLYFTLFVEKLLNYDSYENKENIAMKKSAFINTDYYEEEEND
jgi:hypothetical protein